MKVGSKASVENLPNSNKLGKKKPPPFKAKKYIPPFSSNSNNKSSLTLRDVRAMRREHIKNKKIEQPLETVRTIESFFQWVKENKSDYLLYAYKDRVPSNSFYEEKLIELLNTELSFSEVSLKFADLCRKGD